MKNTIVICSTVIILYLMTIFLVKLPESGPKNTVYITNTVEKPVEKIVEKIVEKPVVEYVDKYITNVVEKVVEAEIPPQHQFALEIHKRIQKASYLDFDKLPSGISDLKISVLVDKKYEDKINPKQLSESIEFEARKIGLKISKDSNYYLYYEIDILPLDDDLQFVYTTKLSISRESILFATPEKTYRIMPELWSKSSFGIVGKNKLNQTYFIENTSQKMTSFCNRVLETREK